MLLYSSKIQIDFPLPRANPGDHTFRKDFLPDFQEKLIYKRGKFKWATSFGHGPIDLPPFCPSDAQLSEGDVFIRIDVASSASGTDRVQVWCSLAATSTPRLIWRRITVLEDVRIIDGASYVLSLSKNTEPSWILVRSAGHPRIRMRAAKRE